MRDLAALVITLSLATAAVSDVVYVDDDAPAGGDGASWATAHRFLQEGLDHAAELAAGGALVEVRVGAGVYEPDRDEANPDGTDDTAATFMMIDGVGIEGGYAGFGAPDPDERNTSTYVSVLSGAIGQPHMFDNSMHVVTAMNLPLPQVPHLDGVVVSGGFAANGDDGGAGILVIEGELHIDSCIVEGNTAVGAGGGLDARGARVVANATIFRGNASNEPAFGGAVEYRGGGDPGLFTNCVFNGNEGGYGAAIRILSGECAILNCTFASNVVTTGFGGGGIANVSGAVDVANTIFWANSPDAIATAPGATTTVASSIVQGGHVGMNNSQADPRFRWRLGADGQAGTADDDLRPSWSSPAIDSGDNTLVPAAIETDVNGAPRFQDDIFTDDANGGDPAVVDRGAFEYGLPTVYFDDERLWCQDDGGNWFHDMNWYPQRPFPGDTAIFFLQAQYGVHVGQDASVERMRFVDGSASFDLQSGVTFEVTDPNPGALSIGGYGASAPRMDIAGGTFVVNDALVDDNGVVSIGAGAVLAANTLTTRGSGQLDGKGVFQGHLINTGTFSPGGRELTEFTIEGDLDQVGLSSDGLPVSGAIVIDIGDDVQCDSADRIDITGTAVLGGALIVRLGDACTDDDLPVGTQFTILTAGTIFGRFDAASLPTFSDERFMRLIYNTASDGGGEVVLEVTDLETMIEFEPPFGEDVAGQATAATIGFFNFDPCPDLAIAVREDGAPGRVLILLNDCNGEFFLFDEITVGFDPVGVVAGNFDGDAAFDDIAVAHAGEDTFAVSFNFGEDFEPAIFIPVGDPDDGLVEVPTDLASANFIPDFGNGENPLDDIVVVTGSSGVFVFENQGGGDFQQSNDPAFLGGSGAGSVCPIDPDNDKCIDIVVTDPKGDRVVVIENDGGDQFPQSSRQDIETGEGPSDATEADVNGDGMPDIVTTDEDGGSLSVIVQDESEGTSFTYLPAAVIPVGVGPKSITTLDADLDGDDDLAVIYISDDQFSLVSIIRNDLQDGEVQFAWPQDIGGSPFAEVVLSDNVDQDQDEDVLTVNGIGGALPGGTSSYSVMLNTTAPPFNSFGDIDGDGVVDVNDLIALLAQWGCTSTCSADLDGNGVVDVADLLALLSVL